MVFTDIEGSTRLLERLGPERYRESLELHRRLLREAFERHGGYEVDWEGDAFFVAFGRAVDAVAAAGEGQQALAAADWPEGLAIRVRMGIHTGEPLAAPPKYVGLDVHKAARIMAAGHGGQVLLSAAAQRLVSTDFAVCALGEHRLRDLAQPEPLYQLRIEGLQAEFPALKTLGNRPNNLPVVATPFIGRNRELADLREMMRRHDVRLLTVTGPGGIGKTRLALQAAADALDSFPSGVFWVPLAPVRDPARVVSAIAEALSVREAPGEPISTTLTRYLAEKALLLVLDNVEHVTAAAPEIGAALLAAPKLRVVATSREALQLRGEHVYDVSPLSLPEADDLAAVEAVDAVQLLSARARAADREFEVTAENAAVIAAIVRRLEGIPLAIELAAARARELPPRALLRRLDSRLRVLTSGNRDADKRQQTLRATIEWSYDLLSPVEQSLFARLSVFAGGCRIEAAEAVCDQEDTFEAGVFDGIASLIQKSLLRRRIDPDGEPRFWMLETLREYGLERLQAADLQQTVTRKHARHYLEVAEQRASLSEQDVSVMRVLEADHGNFRAAISCLHSTDAGEEELRLVSALADFWDVHGHYSEAWECIRLAVDAHPADATAVRAKALAAASDFARIAGDVGLARTYSQECLEVSRAIGDDGAVARALHELGEAALAEEAYDEAAALFEEAIAVGRAAGLAPAGSIGNLGWTALLQGRPEVAAPLFEESLRMFRERGHAGGVLVGLSNLAETELALRHREEAREYLLQGLALAAEADAAGDTTASMLETAVALLLDADAVEEAASVVGASDALLEAKPFSLHPAEHRRRTQNRLLIEQRLGGAAAQPRAQIRDGGATAIDLAIQSVADLTPRPAGRRDATADLDGAADIANG